MPITVPQPITNPPPFQVSRTPYNVAQGAWNSNAQRSGMGIPQYMSPQSNLQASTGVVPNPQQLMTPQAPAVAQRPLKSNVYTPPNPYLVNQMLNALRTGGSVDPVTGWYGSRAQAMGKAGGSALANFKAHGGTLDPASAQYAVEQFKQQLGSGAVTPGGGYGQWWGGQGPATPGLWGGTSTPIPPYQGGRPISPAFQAPQTTNYFNPEFSQPGSMSVSTKGYRNY